MPLQDLGTQWFQLPNLLHTVSSFEFKANPHHRAAEFQTYAWFDKYNVYTERKREEFFRHDYASLCAWSYPETPTQTHLETCIAFNLWLFAYDDIADESELKQNLEGLELGANISIQVLRDPDGPVPSYRFARMLQDFFWKMRATGSAGCCRRFVGAFEVYTRASLCQTTHRIEGRTPSVQEFIQTRRDSSATRLVFAFIEYAMALDIPDDIYNHPSIDTVVDAAADIVAWNNDICSFNNEQSHGDTQNLVYCALVEQSCTLQDAMDYVADMVRTRIQDFLVSRKAVPSFGPDVEQYLKGLEYWISGSMHWYYHSKRYFRSSPGSDGQMVELYQRREEPIPLTVASLEGFSASA